MPKIEKTLSFINGNSFVLKQDSKSNLYAYVPNSGTLRRMVTTQPTGTWEDLTFTVDNTFSLYDRDILNIVGDTIGDVEIVILLKAAKVGIFKVPDKSGVFSYKDPYRFYYAYDTELLYLNMASSWVPIASLNAKNFRNFDVDQYEQLTQTVQTLQDKVEELQRKINSLS